MSYSMRNVTLRTIWGLAKSPELHMTDEELHLLVSGHTGKESLKQLTKREISLVAGVLAEMKESTKRQNRQNAHPSARGNPATVNQRKKVWKLSQELGWDNPVRVDGMCKRMFHVDKVEWLNYQQCSALIEALKGMAERKEGKVD